MVEKNFNSRPAKAGKLWTLQQKMLGAYCKAFLKGGGRLSRNIQFLMVFKLFSSEFIGYIVCLSFIDYVLVNITSALRIT